MTAAARYLLSFLAMAVAARGAVAAEATARDLVLVGRPSQPAEFRGVDAEGRLAFVTGAGEPLTVKLDELVRWSTPAPARAADEVHLAAGHRLCLAAAWDDRPTLALTEQQVRATTNLAGELEVDRAELRGLMWRLPPDRQRRFELSSKLYAAGRADVDVVQLENGDVLSGRVAAIESQAANNAGGVPPAESTRSFLTLEGTGAPARLPIDRLRGAVMAADPARGSAPGEGRRGHWVVGLRDGSRIVVESLAAAGGRLELQTPDGWRPRVDAGDVVYLQALGGRVTYLSDLEPAGYRHEPYLELAWPYRGDASAAGGPLVVGDREFPKGLGMHSAARLSYALDGRHDRFAASVAVDDAAQGGGSVVVRVFLRRGDRLDEAYASPILRGGAAPLEVSVPLAGASELALVVDYADRGDERDLADWVDARLESP